MASVDTVNASSSSSLPFTDVYLSFRGEDTHNSITGHLFAAMNRNGIHAFRGEAWFELGRSVHSKLLRAIEESKFAVIVFSKNYAFSTWCLMELAMIVDCMERKKLIVLPIFYHVDPSDMRNQTRAFSVAFDEHKERFKDSREDVNLWRVALRKAASIPGFVLNYGDPESQLIDEFIELLSNQMLQDGSTNWNLPPRYDATPDESDDADDDDADEMVPDNVSDLPLIGLENESLSNLSNEEVQVITNFIESVRNWMPEDGSTNWNLSPRFDVTPDESDDADDDVDEMVQDNVADLPLELPPRYDDYINDAVDVMQEAHVVLDDVADAPQEAHVVLDDVADAPQACPICVTNARNMAFLCGHTTCVECGERLDTCHICRKPISRRIRLFLG